MSQTKAIVYTLDMIISFIIFFLALGIFLFYFYNYQIKQISEADQEADIIINHLISQGTPSNWTPDLVYYPGLLSDEGVFSKDKFSKIRQIPYNELKKIFGVKNDFFFFIHNYSDPIIIDGSCGYGHPEIMYTNCNPLYGIELLKPNTIVRRDAIIALPPDMVYLTLFVWEK